METAEIFTPPKRPPVTGGKPFELVSGFEPAGDQPEAIAELTEGLKNGERDQVLLGVTGSGKTFTIAHAIQNLQRPTLVLAPNKTLAAQLYGEMKEFFPGNAVEYFVSYYDYYQPEAYVPRTDTYIEKDASINEQIDRMRHAATRALMERSDTIIVASVSCIYGIGAVETYTEMVVKLRAGGRVDRSDLLKRLVELQYRRNDANFYRGAFRVRGDVVEIFPSHLEDRAWRLSLFGDELEQVWEIDPLTGEKIGALDEIIIYPNSHYVTPRPTLLQAIPRIREELKQRLEEFNAEGKLVEAQAAHRSALSRKEAEHDAALAHPRRRLPPRPGQTYQETDAVDKHGPKILNLGGRQRCEKGPLASWRHRSPPRRRTTTRWSANSPSEYERIPCRTSPPPTSIRNRHQKNKVASAWE